MIGYSRLSELIGTATSSDRYAKVRWWNFFYLTYSYIRTVIYYYILHIYYYTKHY